MLASLVIKLEQHRVLQQSAAKHSFPKFPLITRLSPEGGPANQISKFSPWRTSASLLAQRPPRADEGFAWHNRDFAGSDYRTTERPMRENETFSQSGHTTSNRDWSKYRSYRKQMIKPCLTGARTSFYEITKIVQNGAGTR